MALMLALRSIRSPMLIRFGQSPSSHLFSSKAKDTVDDTVSASDSKASKSQSKESATPPPPPEPPTTSFISRDINSNVFPDIRAKKLRRGTGGRSSYSGLTVTVFGSTGFLARSVVNGLARIGCQVICPYRGDPYFTRELKLAGDLGQILFVPFSLNDKDSLHRAMKHSNVVINLIGRDNATFHFSFDDVHVQAAKDIASIAKEIGIKRLVHVSALNSSANPPAHFIRGGSRFLKSKYAGELAVREEFPEATIFRPADMYGVMDKYLWYYCMFYRRKYRKLALPNGGYGITKTPVSVSDVAQGIVNAITDEDAIGKTYDAVGPRRYELRMMLEYLQDVIHKLPIDGFKITNLRWDPFFRTRVSLYTLLAKYIARNPKVSWEKIEREAITDEKPSNPTLLDLGVKLSYIEDKWPSHLIIWRFDFSYEGDLGEKKLFKPPPYVLDN